MKPGNKDLHDKDVAVAFYDDWYEEGYMEEWDDLKKNKVREVISLLGLPAAGKALDFGCGNGVFTTILKEMLPGWDVYGVEISKVAVQNARKKYPSCHFFSADEGEGYARQFDFVFSHHVLEHVPDIDETLAIVDAYLKPSAAQLHILPCGNEGSFEYDICALRADGIERDRGNRFFFEEPTHLRRLRSEELVAHERKIGFELELDFYSNQYHGAVNWITQASPSFVKRLTDTAKAKDSAAAEKLRALRSQLLPVVYQRFAFSKFSEIRGKWRKKAGDYAKLAVLAGPALVASILSRRYERRAQQEWAEQKRNPKGSEMFLYFKRRG